MKYIAVGFISIFTFNKVSAQNIVLNAGFEDTMNCATWTSIAWPQLPCLNWYQSIGTADFFSLSYTQFCGTSWFPNSVFGYQLPNSGQNCAGFAGSGFPNIQHNKELITGMLAAPLIANHKYYVSFSVNSANFCHIKIDRIGAYFSIDSINSFNVNIYLLIPQVENPQGNIITDTLNWTKISGSFIAAGGEKFISIGCFRHDSLLSFDSLSIWSDPSAYYFLDDVSVIDCTAITLNELPELQINAWYNAIDKAIKINTTENNLSFTLINAMGKVVMQDNLVQNEISAAALSRGVYMLVVEDKRYRRRVFKVGVY